MTNPENKKPIIYLLSTCPRCKRVKQLLEDMNVNIEKVTVDLLDRKERDEIVDSLRKHRPVISFPVIQTADELLFAAEDADILRLFGGVR